MASHPRSAYKRSGAYRNQCEVSHDHPGAAKAVHRRATGRCDLGTVVRDDQPGDRPAPGEHPGGERRGHRPGRRRSAGSVRPVVADQRGGARADPEAGGRSVAGAPGRARPARGPRYRQADRRGDGGRRRFGRGLHRVLRRAGGEPARRAHRPRPRLRLYPARAARRLRRDRRLELPAPDRLLEVRRRRSPAAMPWCSSPQS